MAVFFSYSSYIVLTPIILRSTVSITLHLRSAVYFSRFFFSTLFLRKIIHTFKKWGFLNSDENLKTFLCSFLKILCTTTKWCMHSDKEEQYLQDQMKADWWKRKWNNVRSLHICLECLCCNFCHFSFRARFLNDYSH